MNQAPPTNVEHVAEELKTVKKKMREVLLLLEIQKPRSQPRNESVHVGSHDSSL